MRKSSPTGSVASLSLCLGSALLLILASTALAVHPRPNSGSPLRVPLVSAITQCPNFGGNVTHVSGAPACTNPGFESGILTTGSTGAGAGSVKFEVFCAPPSVGPLSCSDVSGDQEDIRITAAVTDVQCAGVAALCAGAGTDYTGSVIYNFPIRLTDHASGPSAPCANSTGTSPCFTATVIDANIGLVVPCTPSGSPSSPPGSKCNITTTVDTAQPGTVIEFQRQSYRFFDEVQVRDLGADGSAGGVCPQLCGTGDEGVTRAQGLFAP